MLVEQLRRAGHGVVPVADQTVERGADLGSVGLKQRVKACGFLVCKHG